MPHRAPGRLCAFVDTVGGVRLWPADRLVRVRALSSRRCPATGPLVGCGSACDGQASTCSSPSGSSDRPIATAVCEPWCGPAPIITSAISTLPTVVTEPEAAAGMPNNRAGARASFEPRHGMAPAGRHLVLKLGRTRPAGGSGASPSGPLERYGKPQRLAVISIRRISRAVHPSSCDRLSQNGSAWEMSEVSGGRAAWRNPASVPCILT